MRVVPLLLALMLVTAAGCGDGDEDGDGAQPPPTSTAPAGVELSLRVSDGEGAERTGRLVCRDGMPELGGYLRGEDGARLCRLARDEARFLASQPEEGRVCTQIYGGPQTARIRGRVGERGVDRPFARRNGCEIADWERVEPLLAPGLR